MHLTASTQDGSYPRPQLLRQDWLSLDGAWDFAYDDADVGRAERWFEPGDAHAFPLTIRVPFVPESEASGIADPGFHSVVWYRRTLELTRPAAGSVERHLVHFGAVDHSARVWVDGQLVTTHVGGQTSFSADITDALVDGAQHTLVVRAEDDAQNFEQPRGKQDWKLEPHAIWYDRSTGIWRTVWLETVGKQRVARLDWASDRVSGAVQGSVTLAERPLEGTSMSVTLSLDDGVLAELSLTAHDVRTDFSIQLPSYRNEQDRELYVWTPERPTLVDAELVLNHGGAELDHVWSYLGIRSTTVGHGAFLLNNRPTYVRSVLEQGYWEESHLTPPSPEALRHEVEQILALGFNAARIHQKVADPRFLYWADRLGLMIWGETAAAYEFSATAVQLLMTEWMAIVEQCRNHPSIVTWVPLNESWGVHDISVSAAQREYSQALVSVTRALDPTRPVVSNDGWEHVDSDILGLHDYASDPADITARYGTPSAIDATLSGIGPSQRPPMVTTAQRQKYDAGLAPLMITEFGGTSYAGGKTWGYTVVDSDEGYRDHLDSLFAAIRGCAGIAGFCYTQLTDTLQEANGLLRKDRTPKLAMETLRAIVTG